MFRPILAGLLASIAAASAGLAEGAKCYPAYHGVSTSAILRFEGDDRGVVELVKYARKRHFSFTITFSNGFSREYLMLSDIKDVDSVVMEMNSDFTPSKTGHAPFVITPDLPVKFYYATMQDATGLHDFLPDDTWRLIGCNP